MSADALLNRLDVLRLPPQSVEAEQCVLGGLMLDNTAWNRVADLLNESDFYRADHGLIYRHISRIIEANKPADVVTVAEALDVSDELPKVGGIQYLNALAGNTPSAANIRRYCELVRERAQSRALLGYLEELTAKAYAGSEPALLWQEIAERAKDALIGNARRIYTGREFLQAYTPAAWLIDRILQRGYVYALTALWGHGKTAIGLTVSLHIAGGRALHGLTAERAKVLYLCGENPDDVRARVIAALDALCLDPELVLPSIEFTDRPFKIDDKDEMRRFLAEAAARGPYGLVVVDTGPAHSDRDEENSNTQSHELAVALRSLIEPLGHPAVLALMHPVKNATRENLQPCGGGAFSGSIDGELCAWLEPESTMVELFHRNKLRGPGFNPLWFDLQSQALDQFSDNFGHHPLTVVALPCAPPERSAERKEPKLSADARIALEALKTEISASGETLPATSELPGSKRGVRIDAWRARFYALLGESREIGHEAKRKAFQRGSKGLISEHIAGVFGEFAWLW